VRLASGTGRHVVVDETVYLLCLSPEKIRYLIRVVEGDLAVCDVDKPERGWGA